MKNHAAAEKGACAGVKLSFSVPPEWDQKRVGDFLRKVHGVSGTTLKLAKRTADGITLDGKHIRTVDPLRAGGVLCLCVDREERQYAPLFLPVPILYEDESFLAFDKPAHLASHPSLGHPRDTLANVYASLPQTKGLCYRPLGRLDKDTTGVLLTAKNAHAAYAARILRKQYLALLGGELPSETGVIDAPIGREGEDTLRRTVRPDGQRAVTRWQALHSENGYTLARLWLDTGRTHQIRVHMAHLSCPLEGDALYGGDMTWMDRQALHCEELTFFHPILQKEMTVKAPVPRDLSDALSRVFPRWREGEKQGETAAF